MYTFDENINRIEQAKNDIKQAIEEKGVEVGNGNINTYASKIKMIKATAKSQTKTTTITKNNTTTTISPDDGYSLDKVTVKTKIPIGSTSVEYNTNGTYSLTPEEGVEGYNKVDITVDIPIQKDVYIEYTSNGLYEIEAEDGYTGLNNVEVSVDVPIQDNKTVSYTANGSYDITPDSGYVGLKTAEIEVNIPLEKGVNKTFNKNGEYKLTPSDGYKAIEDATIVVEVAGGGATILPDGITLQNSTFTELDMSQWDWSNVYTWDNMFYNCTNLKAIHNVPQNIKPYGGMTQMFAFCNNLVSVDMNSWNTSNIMNMGLLFHSSRNLVSVDMSSCDLSNVKDISYMFTACSKLIEIKMGGDVSNVTNTLLMFNGVGKNGTFYYNSQYDYSKIIAELPSTWTAIPL